MSASYEKSRAQLRGKPLDKDCYKARVSTHEYGANDNRKFCYGLIDLRTDELCKECQSCKANVMNAQALKWRDEDDEKL